jgi:hypothetical protein
LQIFIFFQVKEPIMIRQLNIVCLPLASDGNGIIDVCAGGNPSVVDALMLCMMNSQVMM